MKSFKDYYLVEKKKSKRKKRRLKFKRIRQYYGYPFWGPGWYNHDIGATGVGDVGGESGGGGE